MLHIKLLYGVYVVWEGRIEDITITQGGINITAFGYWRALSDVPYTAMWSVSSIEDWRIITTNDISSRVPSKYQFDKENRLFITLEHNATYTNGSDVGSFVYQIPDSSSRQITAVSFDYSTNIPTNWVFQYIRHQSGFTLSSGATVVTGNGATQSGTVSTSLTACDYLELAIFNNTGASYNFTGENGDRWLKVTNIRIKTTTSASVCADEIAKALAAYINNINSTQLSSSTALIQSPALDLKNEVYEEETPSDILNRLVALGDNQTPPRIWEVGVWENQMLHFRPRSSASQTWYVDVTDLDLERTIETLTNSVYAVYQDTTNRTLRTSVNADSASVSRYGITRRSAIKANTTSSIQAGVQRDVVLVDRKEPLPRATIEFNVIYDQYGARHPLFMLRSGDTITIRNLPSTIIADKVRTFRISRTDYDSDSNTISVEPELPQNTLDVMLARQLKGF
jgi:hypothetical protein